MHFDLTFQHDHQCAATRSLFAQLRDQYDHGAIGHWFEEITRGFYRGVLQPGDHAIDVGAAGGRHTLPMLRAVGGSGQVFAAEASPAMRERLAGTLKLATEAERAALTILPFAIAAEDGEDLFTDIKGDPARSGLRSVDIPVAEDGVQVFPVQVRHLDGLIADPSRIRFIKLDIEGAELPALMGAERILTVGRPCLAFENGGARYMQRFGYSEDDFFGLFARFSYLLVTPFGTPFDREWFRGLQPHQLFAVPLERSASIWNALVPAIFQSALVGSQSFVAYAAVSAEPPAQAQPAASPAAAQVGSATPLPGSVIQAADPDEVARAMDREQRLELLASAAFHAKWSAEPATRRLRDAIARCVVANGEYADDLLIRLEDGTLVAANPAQDAVIARRFLLDAGYDQGLVRWLNETLQPGDVMLDVGSCYGHMTVAGWRAVGHDGLVMAIEANPAMARRTRDTLRRNGWPSDCVLQTAIGEHDGTSRFFVYDRNVGGSRLAVGGISDSPELMAQILAPLTVVSFAGDTMGQPVSIEQDGMAPNWNNFLSVPTRTLDSIVAEIGRPVTVLKMDIVGAELLGLRGARRLLAGAFGPPPIIVIEYSDLFPTFGGHRSDIFTLLAGQGWRATRFLNGKSVGGTLAPIACAELAPTHDDLIFFPPPHA